MKLSPFFNLSWQEFCVLFYDFQTVMKNVIQLHHSQWCNICDGDDFPVQEMELCDWSYNVNFISKKKPICTLQTS